MRSHIEEELKLANELAQKQMDKESNPTPEPQAPMLPPGAVPQPGLPPEMGGVPPQGALPPMPTGSMDAIAAGAAPTPPPAMMPPMM